MPGKKTILLGKGKTKVRYRRGANFSRPKRKRKMTKAMRDKRARLNAVLNPEIKHAVLYTNADINNGENPTDSRMFMVHNESVGGTYADTFNVKGHLGTIVQGDGQSDRVGNKITIKNWKLNVTVSSVKDYPLMVRMFLGRPKTVSPIDTSIANTSWAQLLQQGSITTSPQSTYLTYQQPVNTDYWTIKMDKRFIINGLGDSTDGSGEPDRQLSSLAAQYPDFRKFTIDLTKYFPRDIVYDDDTADPRVGKPLFLFFQTCTLGSQASHSITGNPYAVYCDIVQTLDYYDV